MNHLRVQAMLEEMVKAILDGQEGFVHLGNVWMAWDGKKLTWDTPLSEWNVNEVWRSLMEQAEYHPKVEHIANCAENLANMYP